MVEQVHCRVKRRAAPVPGVESFMTPRPTLAGLEARAMLAKSKGRGDGGDMPVDTDEELGTKPA